MLQLILGGSGSGKTDTLYQRIEAGLRAADHPVMLLAPEQFSFETERTLSLLLPAPLSSRVQVLSFTRLCHAVFRALGGEAARYLDDAGRDIFIHLALHETQDQLTYYVRQAAYPAFQQELLRSIAECKNALIPPEALLQTAERLDGDDALRHKLSDIAVVYAAYNALVARSCLDPLDNPARAAALLKDSRFFADCDLYIDGFKDFTASQELLLTHALAGCASVTVTLCADSLYPRGEDALFAPAQHTAERLLRLARRADCPVAEPLVLNGSPRFQKPALARLEQCLFRFEPPPEDGEAPAPDGICVTAARTLCDEVEQTAADIRRLVRCAGYRYREIAVLARQLDPYRQLLLSALRRYEIPVFCDERADIRSTPLALFALAALRAVSGRFDTGQLLLLGKTGLLAVPDADLQALENYCYTYDVNGDAWLTDFIGNPDGLVGALNEEQAERLERINTARAALIQPLCSFRAAAAETDGAGLSRAVYALLTDYRLPETIERLLREAQALPEDDRALFAELPRVWNLMIDALDRLADTTAGVAMSVERYTQLLTAVLADLDYGVIPQTLDAVLVGEVGRVRVGAPRAVFLLGVNEGVFPRQMEDSGLFTEQERAALTEAGLKLAGGGVEDKYSDERFLAYTAATAASERLSLSYPLSDLRAGEKKPSELIRQVLRCFPALSVRPALSPQDERLAETYAAAFAVYCAGFYRPAPLTGSLYALLSGHPLYGERVDRLEALRTPPPFALQRRQSGERLFGRQLRLSPSQLDRFYQCRFSYFCRYGVQARPRPRAKITGLETGSLTHYVLEQAVLRYPGRALCDVAPDALRQALNGMVDDFVEKMLAGGGADTRSRYLLTRIKRAVFLLVRHLADELRQSEFVPADAELPIGEGGVPPILVKTPLGATVQVWGVVDRVDLMEKDGVRYVRVVDYKTGAKSFRLSDVYQGINMQMLLYLFSIWRNGRERYGDVVPAGVLYMPASAAVQKGVREGEDDGAFDKALKMNGLLLNDPVALQGMEQAMAGVFIPCKQRRDGGFDARSSLATLEQFGRLSGLIERRVSEMADRLLTGDIAALPLHGGGLDPCRHCDYRAVCKREDADPAAEYLTAGPEEVWARLEEDGI